MHKLHRDKCRHENWGKYIGEILIFRKTNNVTKTIDPRIKQKDLRLKNT